MQNDEKESIYISISKASALSGLCLQTLRKLADNKKIASYKTISGQRKFNKSDIIQMCSNKLFNNENKNDIYVRITLDENEEELEKQIVFIKSQKKEYESNNKRY